MKVNGHWVPCVHPPTVLFRFFSNCSDIPDHDLKIRMWFEYNPQINV